MKFQDTLNTKLWDLETNDLHPEVKSKLEEIANAFIEYIEIPQDAVLDMVITGSSASYNYNEHSDLDLHIIVDYDKIHDDCPLVEGYLGALKNTFNKEHDIFIHGVPVELYAEQKDQGTVHNGLYSLQTGWIDEPQKIPPTDNDAAVEAKFNEIKEMVDKCDDSEEADELLDKIYNMRKAGLAEAGEFCTENLAFKKLRNEGCMDKLRQLKKEKIDKQLSLESYNEDFQKLNLEDFKIEKTDSGLYKVAYDGRIGYIKPDKSYSKVQRALGNAIYKYNTKFIQTDRKALISKLHKLFKQAGIPKMQDMTSSIRGYRPITKNGYYIDIYPGDRTSFNIGLSNSNEEYFNKIKQILDQEGISYSQMTDHFDIDMEKQDKKNESIKEDYTFIDEYEVSETRGDWIITKDFNYNFASYVAAISNKYDLKVYLSYYDHELIKDYKGEETYTDIKWDDDEVPNLLSVEDALYYIGLPNSFPTEEFKKAVVDINDDIKTNYDAYWDTYHERHGLLKPNKNESIKEDYNIGDTITIDGKQGVIDSLFNLQDDNSLLGAWVKFSDGVKYYTTEELDVLKNESIKEDIMDIDVELLKNLTDDFTETYQTINGNKYKVTAKQDKDTIEITMTRISKEFPMKRTFFVKLNDNKVELFLNDKKLGSINKTMNVNAIAGNFKRQMRSFDWGPDYELEISSKDKLIMSKLNIKPLSQNVAGNYVILYHTDKGYGINIASNGKVQWWNLNNKEYPSLKEASNIAKEYYPDRQQYYVGKVQSHFYAESLNDDYPKDREELINKYKGVFKKNGITLEISNLYNKKEDNFSGGFGKSYNVEGKVFNKFEKALEYMKKLSNKNESIKEDYEDDDYRDDPEEMHKERYATYFETQEGNQKYTIYHVYTDSTDDSYNELCDKRDNQLGMYDSYQALKDALKDKAEKIAAKQGWTVKSIENLGEDDEYYRERNKWESIKETRDKFNKNESLNEEDDKFNYMMLGRLKQDCEYFLGNGNGHEKHLWAGNVEDQISEMRKIYDKLPEKPEWLSLEDIDKYEKDMLAKRETTDEIITENLDTFCDKIDKIDTEVKDLIKSMDNSKTKNEAKDKSNNSLTQILEDLNKF